MFAGSDAHLRSYSYVGDMVDGLCAAMDHFDHCVGEIFNLGAEEAITTAQAIRVAEELIGRPARIVAHARRASEQLRTRANSAKARRVLGFAPRVSLEDGLARQIAWYRAHISGKLKLW